MRGKPKGYYVKMYDATRDESYFMWHHSGPPPLGAVKLWSEDEIRGTGLDVFAPDPQTMTLVRKPAP